MGIVSNLEKALQLNLFEELDALPIEFEEYVHSEKYLKNIKRLFDKMRGDKLHRFTKRTATIILIAAILFALLIVGFGATVGREFVIRTFEDHFEYIITDRSNSRDVTDLRINYIPDGFMLEDEENRKNYKWCRFTKDKYCFEVKKMHVNANTEYDTIVKDEKTTIDGVEFVYYSSVDNNWNGYIFNNGNYVFQVDGNIQKKELLKISQSID